MTTGHPQDDALPDARTEPTITVPRAGRILGLSRQAAYDAAKRGDIPTIHIGRRIVVPTAKLLALLGIGAESGGANR